MPNDLQLSVRLTGDGRQLVGTLRDAEGHVRQFGDVSESQSARVSSALSGIRTAAGFAAAALGGLTLGRVINETAQFQDTMLGLRAVSGATAEQMRSLQEQARTLGATTRYSAQEAGEAQRYLAQAGLQVNQVLSATPGILNLATAGQLDLAQAADIASNVLGGMQLPVSELNRVMDVMAAAASSSNTNIQQLGEALKEAAPIAKTAGLSIEETTTAISILSNAGIQSGRAGTAVLGFIRQLSNITPQAKDVLASYGLTLQDVNLETRGLANVLDTLLDANISTADAFKIFASEAGPAAQVLTSGADSAREFIQRLKDAAGATDEMAAILGSGLSNSLRTLNSALSESILQIGEGGLGGAVGYLADTSAGVLSVYNDMLPAFAKANNLTSKQVDTIESLADGFGALALVAGVKLTSALGSSATAFVKNQYALQANYEAGVEYTQQVMRRTAAEVRASEQIYARAVADAKATSGTNAHAFALTNLAAADARATEAKSAHTVATNAYTAAAERASIASRAAAGAMALVGGPLGAAMLAGAAVYYFRDELGLTSPAAREAKGEIDALVKSLDNYTQAQYESNRVPIVKDLAEARIEAKKLQDQIDDLKDQGKDQGMWYQGFSGSATHEIAELNTQLREQERIIAANEAGLSEYDKKWQDVIQSQTSGVAIFKTLDQWMDGLGGKFRDTSVGVQSVSLALGASGEDWDSYISKLQDARNTLGMTAAEAEKYAATQAGYTGLYAEQAGAVAGQTAALEDYRSAIEKGNKAEAQAHLSRAQRYAEAESMVIAQLQNLDTLTGLLRGVQTELSATALSAALVIGDSAGNTSALIAESLRLLNERAAAIRQNTVVTKKKTEADRAAAQAARSQANALQALQDKLDPVAKSQRDFLADQITLQTAWAGGKLTLDQYLTAVAKLPTLYQNAGDAAEDYGFDATKAAKKVDREMTYLETAIKRSVERLDDAFVDFWENVISGGKNTFDAFKQVAISTLAEIAHAYTTRRITVSLGLPLAGTGSPAAGGTGAGGMGGFGGGGGFSMPSFGMPSFDSLSGAWTTAQNAWAGFNGTYGASLGVQGGISGTAIGSANSVVNGTGIAGASNTAFGAGTTTAGLATAITNAIAYYAAYQGGGMVGNKIGTSLTGKTPNSNIGQMLGTVGGSFWGVPGAFVGSTIGGVVDSIFGSSRKYTAGFESFAETPDRDFGAGGTPYYSSGYYRDGDLGLGRETPFGSFGFTDKTKFEPSDMIDMLDAMAALDQTLASAANETQIESVKNALDGWQTRLKNDSLGELVARRYAVVSETLENEASEATAKLIERVGEITADSAERTIPQLAQALQLGNLIDGLSGNVKTYAEKVVDDTSTSLEDAFSQITAGVAAHAAVSGIADELNLTFDDMGERAVEAALNLQQLAGGLDALQSQAQTYYANFFSAEEQRQRAIDQIAPTLEAAGLSAESTRAQFRAVVESLDLNTESGRQTYSELMSVAGAFAQLSESAADAAKRAEEIERQRWSLQNDLLRAQGNGEAALARERQRQLEQMPETLRALQQEIWAIDERNKAAEQQALLQRTALYRDGTVGAVDGLIDRYQRAMEVAQTAADERQRQLENEKRALATIGDMLDAMRLSDQSILSPAERLAESRRQFAALQVRAEAGDTDALSQLGQAKTTYLTAAGDYYGQASAPYAAIYTEVESALSGLEDQYGESLEAQGSLENVQRQVLEAQRQARNTLLSSLEQQVQQSTRLQSIADLVSLLPPSLADSLSAIFPEYATDVGSSFDAAAYLTNKTAEVNAKRQGGRDDWTPGEVYDRILKDYGSLEAHYQQIGRDEGVSPTYQSGEDTVGQQTRRFDEDTYVANQVAYLNDRDRGERTWSGLQFYMALDDANLSAYEHWLRYGRAEGVAAYAQGGAFTNGIVQEPTYFDTGLMGEAGPEAIMPLTRTADGSLGVRSLPSQPMPFIDAGPSTTVDLRPVVAELQALRQDNVELRARLDALVETSSDTAVHTRATAAHSKRTAENVAEGNRHSRTRQRMPV
ncbi:phage tail tape measure protein [Salinicola sp. JS01]|uniref:phage tail tape measure protein n=1 Tax=Salinicola sp. JS01 TaxID=3050071 RepID=UPI00255BB895|nr:phage tail tape measure protein [Salinicola sp. JS01]WIX31253.1 phage tail tape measure protein [Salinicola sp. JS01]